MTDRDRNIRLEWLALALALAFAGLVVRLVYLHLLTDETIRQSVEDKGTIVKPILTGRGRILEGSKAGNIVALNVGMFDLCADPALLAKSNLTGQVASSLGTVLGVTSEELRGRLNHPEKRFAYVARQVPDDLVHQIMDLKTPGIFTRETTLRRYPQGGTMCHALGFSNLEGVGSAGVELIADKYLKGSEGFLESRLDGRRREMYGWRVQDIQPQEGADVYLTLDENVQYMVEMALDRAMEKHRARGAWAIVQRIRTGEILALANRPNFDLNEFRTARPEQMLNRAIGQVYEPGSTFKVVAIAGALNEGIITTNQIFNTENGRWSYMGKILRDYHPYSQLTVSDVFKKSSNIGTAKIAIQLGNERFYKYLKGFSIGHKTGVDLPGEEAGLLTPVEKWSGISVSRIAIGQGVAVTALQMLGVANAVANDGFLMKPYLIRRVVAKDGTVLYKGAPEVMGRPIRGDTAQKMRDLMARVTEPGGTGTKGAIEGYQVGGKTGSAQKPTAGGYSETDYMATFVGFLPVQNPEISIIVTVDEPQPFHTGGLVAAPIFKEIAEQAVRYLDISPSAQTGLAGP
jgi:cell division protein FtsI (penicillin-binding protein 3)